MKHSFAGSILKKGWLCRRYVHSFLLERSSLISDIGKVVLDKSWRNSCKNGKSVATPMIRVSVNIVAQQIHRGLLLSDLDEVLDTYHLDGSNLELGKSRNLLY